MEPISLPRETSRSAWGSRILIGVVAGLVLVGAFFLGVRVGLKRATVSLLEDAAVQEVSDQQLEAENVQDTLLFLSGEIVRREGKDITLSSPSVPGIEMGDGESARHLRLTEETRVVRQVPKSREEIMAEERDYRKMIEKDPEREPPLPFREVSVGHDVLQEGMFVSIEAQEGDAGETALRATKISLPYNTSYHP